MNLSPAQTAARGAAWGIHETAVTESHMNSSLIIQTWRASCTCASNDPREFIQTVDHGYQVLPPEATELLVLALFH